ncbi:MAG: hypothetical protein ACRDRP_17605 [Pseudonocardiaceae bacterium]
MPLATELEARPGSEAKEIARMARQVAATRVVAGTGPSAGTHTVGPAALGPAAVADPPVGDPPSQPTHSRRAAGAACATVSR